VLDGLWISRDRGVDRRHDAKRIHAWISRTYVRLRGDTN
jgi:hypothetical protein